MLIEEQVVVQSTFSIIAQIAGMAALLLAGGISLGKLFSDNGTIKNDLADIKNRQIAQGEALAQQKGEISGIESELERARNRLDQFIDGSERQKGSN